MVHGTIGDNRASALGRILALVYLATIGVIVVVVFAILAWLWFVIDILSNLFLNRPLQSGRVILATPLRHHIKLFKYGIFGEEFPGYNPWSTENTPTATA